MNYIKTFEQYSNISLFDKVRNDYFKSNNLDFSLTQKDGYRVKKDDKKILFGTVLTTTPDIEFLFHEMGHFVLFKDYNRLLKNEYGLNYPKHEINGELYDMASNWTDIKNEIRAIIFSKVLSDKYQANLDYNSWIESLRHLDGFTFVPVHNGVEKEYKWYELDGVTEISYNEYEKRKIITMKNFYIEESKKDRYSISNFDHEWFKRLEFISNYFNSN